jgi:hypothetical protein
MKLRRGRKGRHRRQAGLSEGDIRARGWHRQLTVNLATYLLISTAMNERSTFLQQVDLVPTQPAHQITARSTHLELVE